MVTFAAIWTPEALAAAIGVLATAVCTSAVLLARTYIQVANILEGLHRVGIPMRGARGAADPRAARGGGAAGLPPGAVGEILTPPWSQLTDQQMRGSAAGAAAQDCAEECVAIACQAIKRVPVPAEYVRWLWFGAYDARLATADDLAGMLACVDIRSHGRAVAWDIARAEIIRALGAGELAAILGRWLSQAEGHWMLVVEADGTRLVARDPWTGTLRQLSWEQFRALYSGAYVHIDQIADITRPLAA